MQEDLFPRPELFPVRRPAEGPQTLDVKQIRMSAAMSQAIRESAQSREVIAARIGELTGRRCSLDSLNTFTAPAKPEHDIGLMRFVALVRITGATWLWDELLRDDGLTVLEGREARLAQVGHLRQQKQLLEKALRDAERDLERQPVQVKRREGR